MKKLIQICFVLCLVLSARGQPAALKPGPDAEVLKIYDWRELQRSGQLSGGEIISMDGISVLKIENTNNSPLAISLLTITNSSLIQKIHTVTCELKYDKVTGRFLNGNGDGTLAYSHIGNVKKWPFNNESGDIRKNSFGNGGLGVTLLVPPDVDGGDRSTNCISYLINGTSNWKRSMLRVAGLADENLPTGLELNFFLPGTGTVYLRPIEFLGERSNWWSPQSGGLIAGVVGSVIGCLGGIIGCLAGIGKARGFVLGTTKFFIGLGILLTVSGIVAAILKQPYAVWYALLIPGGILTLVFSVNLYPMKRRYEDLEIRRMTSMDATGR